MGSWVETTSPHFAARHDVVDEEDVVGVLELLEGTRERLERLFPVVPDEIDVVVHGSREQLYAAQPQLPVLTRLTAPAARRYLVGWPQTRQIHVLAPRHLRSRASDVPGSRQMAELAPAALLTQVVVGASNKRLPPPFRVGSMRTLMSWAWLWAGTGQFFAGQVRYARPAIARRLREGPRPTFPPRLNDALLLGGSVLDMLGRELGPGAVVRLACDTEPGTPQRAIERVFGRDLRTVSGDWTHHIAELAGTRAD